MNKFLIVLLLVTPSNLKRVNISEIIAIAIAIAGEAETKMDITFKELLKL